MANPPDTFAETVPDIVVDLTVAIVIFTIANFDRGLGSRTGTPVALNTGLLSLPALGLTRPEEPLVDLTVAVVVPPIADFRRSLYTATALPLPLDTADALPHAAGTRGGTLPDQILVNLSIAVIIFAVADLLPPHRR